MEYGILAVGISDELLSYLKKSVAPYKLHFVASLTIQDVNRLVCNQVFHLIIVDLEFLRNIQQADWLAGIRRNTFAPIIILSELPEKDTSRMIQVGADICISAQWPCSVVADLAYAQLRRYTEYNYYKNPEKVGTMAFQSGDIFIDPARRVVTVRGQPVNLRPREFSLLLYFMQNPNIVLTAEQICEHAWEMEGSYNRGVSGPVALLRKAIEPDLANPRYIETIPRIGYRFTAYHDETCDDCSSSVGLL